MSTATAAVAATPPPPVKGQKRLIIIVAAVALVLLLGAVAAVVLLKRKAAAAEGDGADGTPSAAAEVRREAGVTPTFVPLDPFTVNLADRDAERYAQVGVTLEVTDPKLVEEIKTYMPAIRNNVLMAIADRSAAELLGREGKASLATKIRRETSRALGYDVPPDDGDATAGKDRRRGKGAELPIKAVQFSNFIIQ
jgi:flagellar FliL protein